MDINISDAESTVMKVFWEKYPLTCSDVVEALADQQEWQEATVKTFLNRLLKKGALTSEKDGRRFLYSPVLTREEWLSQESEGMLNRLFNGQLAPLVAHFGAHNKLSKTEIAELKELIERLDDEQ